MDNRLLFGMSGISFIQTWLSGIWEPFSGHLEKKPSNPSENSCRRLASGSSCSKSDSNCCSKIIVRKLSMPAQGFEREGLKALSILNVIGRQCALFYAEQRACIH